MNARAGFFSYSPGAEFEVRNNAGTDDVERMGPCSHDPPPDPALSAVLSFGARGANAIMLQLVFAVKGVPMPFSRLAI